MTSGVATLDETSWLMVARIATKKLLETYIEMVGKIESISNPGAVTSR